MMLTGTSFEQVIGGIRSPGAKVIAASGHSALASASHDIHRWSTGSRSGKESAMVRIQGEIVINRPVDEVFDFVADERNEPRYRACYAQTMSRPGRSA